MSALGSLYRTLRFGPALYRSARRLGGSRHSALSIVLWPRCACATCSTGLTRTARQRAQAEARARYGLTAAPTSAVSAEGERAATTPETIDKPAKLGT